jgi:hypothetical protein
MASNCVAAIGLMRWRERQSSARCNAGMLTGYTKIICSHRTSGKRTCSKLLEVVSNIANMRSARAIDAVAKRLAVGCFIDAARKQISSHKRAPCK